MGKFLKNDIYYPNIDTQNITQHISRCHKNRKEMKKETNKVFPPKKSDTKFIFI